MSGKVPDFDGIIKEIKKSISDAKRLGVAFGAKLKASEGHPPPKAKARKNVAKKRG